MIFKLKHFFTMICLLCLSQSLYLVAQETIPLDPPPGLYADSIILQNTRQDAEILLILDDQASGTEKPISLKEPLTLSALPGETREYRFTIIRQADGYFESIDEVIYTIDQTAPKPPRFTPHPLISATPLEVVLHDDYQKDGDTDSRYIEYQVNNSETIRYEKPIDLIGAHGQSIDYRIQAWTVDLAGNTSALQEMVYTIDRTKERQESFFQVLSPVQGRFLNPQLLYIRSSGMKEIRYTIDGTEPKINGLKYDGIVELSGEIYLRIWAIDQEGREFTKEVELSTGTELYGNLNQGYIGDALEIPVQYESMTYVLEDRSPTRFDLPLERSLRIRPQEGSLRALTLRLLRPDAKEYRLFFLLNGFPKPDFSAIALRKYGYSNYLYANISEGETLFSDDIVLGSYIDTYTLEHAPSPEGPWFQIDEEVVNNLVSSGTESIWLRTVNDSQKSSEIRKFSIIWEESKDQDISSQYAEVNESELTIMVPPDGLYVAVNQYPAVFLKEDFSFSFLPEMISEVNLQYWIPNNSSSENRPQYMGSQSLQIDTSLPIGPEIQITDNIVTIKSNTNESIQYRVFSSHNEAPSMTKDFIEYSSPFPLEAIPGENISYRVEARKPQSDGGWILSSSKEFYIHSRPPITPELSGIIDDQIFTARNIILPLKNEENGVVYSFALLNEKDNSFHTGTLKSGLFEFVFGEIESNFILEIWGTSNYNSNLVSPKRQYYFSVDTIKPLEPEIVTDIAEGTVNHPVTITITNKEEYDSLLYYSINNSPAEIYTKPFRIDGEAGKSNTYEIRAFSQDAAGNISGSVYSSFTIDKQPPNAPRVRLFTEEEELKSSNETFISRRDIDLVIEGEGRISYEFTLGNQNPALPSFGSPIFLKPLTLQGTKGSEQKYKLIARSMDSVGNWSPVTNIYTILIDKKAPEPPETPQIIRDGNSGLLSWQDILDTIEYRFSNDLNFTKYTSPIPWSITPGDGDKTIIYRSVDQAGNTSISQSIIIEERNSAPRPVVTIPDSERWKSEEPEILVEPTLPNGIIRYELFLAGEIIPDVTVASPLWQGELNVFQSVGETINYRIVFRQFGADIEPSEPVYESFVIDKAPPLPPTISNNQEKMYTYNSFPLNLEASEQDLKIYVSIEEQNLPPTSFPKFEIQDSVSPVRNIENYAPISGKIDLPGYEGEVTRYLVSSIAIDRAGNISTRARLFEVIIDRASVYLSTAQSVPDQMNHSPGTRENPARTISEAMKYLAQDRRNRLYISTGTYLLNEEISGLSGVVIYGGYNYSWEPSNQETVIAVNANFQDEAMLRFTSGSPSIIGQLFLTDQRGITKRLIHLEYDSDLSIYDSSLVTNGKSQVVYSGQQSRIEFVNTHVLANDTSNSRLIQISENAELILSKTNIEFTQTPDFLRNKQSVEVESLSTNRYTLSLDSARATITDSILNGPQGSVTGIIFVNNSFLELHSSELYIGRTNDLGIGINSIESSIQMSSSLLKGNMLAPSVSLVRAEGGSLRFNGNFFIPIAQRSATGITLRLSELTSFGDTFKNGVAADFIVLYQFFRSNSELQGTKTISDWNTGELIMNTIEASNVTWNDGDLDLRNTGSSLAFQIISSELVNVTNSLFKSNRNSLVFYLAEQSSQMNVRNNTFEGWSTLLVRNDPGWQSSLLGERSISDIPSLEEGETEGQIFIGNQIRQGL